jgi:hypothetical protein
VDFGDLVHHQERLARTKLLLDSALASVPQVFWRRQDLLVVTRHWALRLRYLGPLR